MKKITDEQKEFLDKFECVRISDDKKYDYMTIDFKCKRNPNLVTRLQSEAFKEDCAGVTAHYLIIYDKTIPVLYFALKAGSLFTPLEHDLQEMSKQILNEWKNVSINDEITDLKDIVNAVLNQPYDFTEEMFKVCDKYNDLSQDIEWQVVK